jgi:hypothetical protein
MYRKIIVAVVMALSLVVFAGTVNAQSSTDAEKNQTSYWEAQGFGTCVKYDNVNAETFTVPAAPEGKVYTLAVIKAGSDQSTEEPNETDTSVAAGDVLRHSSGKDISHVILCYKSSQDGGNGDNGGGSGGGDGSVLSDTTQTEAAAAGVNAGFGGASAVGASVGSVAGASISLLSLGHGIRRLRSHE